MLKSNLSLPFAHAQSDHSLLVLREGPVVISPALAEKILKETFFEGQRKTDPVYVQSHLESINRDLWLRSPIAFCKVGYRYYLVNGKHRITACSLGARDLEFSITIHECRSMDEVASIYGRYDTVSRPRSKHQLTAAFDLAGKLGTSKFMATAVYEAVPLLMNRLVPTYYNDEKSEDIRAKLNVPDIRNNAALSWREEAALYERALQKARRDVKKTLLGAQAVSVAMLTLRHSRDLAFEFFKGIAENDGLKTGDPRKTVLEYIYERNHSHIKNVMWLGGPWNAFYRGQTHSAIRAKNDTPIKILGTPLDGRRTY